ncbi:hypothetical protein EV644_12655 [Kribbella orskensis]|uniref:Uncharacterized protein n=1 Tax=Kribbella orskensis TaxID=2512216 RepID=A0ABY2B998_9ACTN|nr:MULTISPECIES: hypothetical protein [Kribbella]TCN31682.1 hypothetical protein EV642_12945 [Kribbella sp. VKM Ac-2500]TCO12312.1 hypothetical protein EV644_12655 [Kribbella orskensis]
MSARRGSFDLCDVSNRPEAQGGCGVVLAVTADFLTHTMSDPDD